MKHWYFLCAMFVALISISIPISTHASHGTSTKTTSSKYDIAVPVLFGVTRASIVPDFGDPRGGGTRSHEGQDIMAPEGTPIVSPVRGTVVGYGSAAMPGKYMYVKGKDGYTYAYMHLEQIAKLKRGQKINVGDLIGTVGETGNAKGTTPHLHFEIRKGKPIDPYTRLKKDFTFEEKIEFLNRALDDLKDDDALVDLMVEQFNGVLLLALAEDLKLDSAFTKALKKYEGPSLGSTTVGTREGGEGEGVRALQRALIGANVGESAQRLAQTGTTGYFGPVTKSALIEFQKAFGLVANGIFTAETKQALLNPRRGDVKGASTTVALTTILPSDLTLGMKGLEVRVLQAYLIKNQVGRAAQALLNEGATGYFGSLTESALREYQKAKGIPETGIYDALTRARILELSVS